MADLTRLWGKGQSEGSPGRPAARPARVKAAPSAAGFRFDVRRPLKAKSGFLVERVQNGSGCTFRDVHFRLTWPRLDVSSTTGEPLEWGQELIQDSVVHPRPQMDGSIADGSVGFAMQLASRDGTRVSTFFAPTNAERSEWCELLRKHSVHHNLENGFKLTQKVLGRGSCASVYLARDRITDEFVALKCIERASLRDGERILLAEEAWIAQDVKHRHCVYTREFIETEVTYVLVMEYVAGGELFERLKYTRYDENVVRSIMRQLLEGVAYLHARDVVHFDLKPENILLTVDNPISIKIADFGLSIDLSAESSCALPACCKTSGLLRCSPGYGAPEIVRMQVSLQRPAPPRAYLLRPPSPPAPSACTSLVGPQPCTGSAQVAIAWQECGREADMWSLGVIAHFLLSHHQPFHGADDQDTRDRMERGEWDCAWLSKVCRYAVACVGEQHVCTLSLRPPTVTPIRC